MVCPRCIYIVENELKELGIEIHHIELRLAHVTIPDNISLDDIDNRLTPYGFKLLKDKDEILVDSVKNKVVEYINLLENNRIKTALSTYVSEEIGKNYNNISKLFSFFESETIEHFYIKKRIERIKELLEDDELSISEISHRLGYSSVHYLSNQFKKITGITPSEHRKIFKEKLENHT